MEGGLVQHGLDIDQDLLPLAVELIEIGQRKKVLIDVKSMLDKKTFDEAGYVYWRL